MPHYLFNSATAEMLLFPALAALLVVFSKALYRAQDRRAVATLLAAPSQLQRAWVCDATTGSVRTSLRGTDGQEYYELASQANIPTVLAHLEAAGVPVYDVPEWCRNTALPVPYECWGHRFLRVLSGYVVPTMVLSAVLQTLLHVLW